MTEFNHKFYIIIFVDLQEELKTCTCFGCVLVGAGWGQLGDLNVSCTETRMTVNFRSWVTACAV